jgi:hypothetical protein
MEIKSKEIQGLAPAHLAIPRSYIYNNCVLPNPFYN